MIRYGNSLPAKLALSNSNHNNVSHRQIVHSRIENEEMIFIKYELGKKIGQGSFGVVYEMTNRETNDRFALKIINKEKAGGRSSFNYEKEVEIMKTVTHRNLVKLEEVFETKKKLYLVTELCDHGELAKWIKLKGGPMSEKEAKSIMKQIVEAIYYLHKNDIVHRDLKLENILIKDVDKTTGECYIKITDFGLSSQRETVGTESMFDDYCGTPLYMAPEIIENHPYSQLCDVWALGIIMYILLTNHSPFTAESDSKLRDQIRRADFDESSRNYKNLSPEAKDCIKRMIRVNPAQRIASSELPNHPWFLDKKIDEMAGSQMNVLELMSEMLHEQENQLNLNNSNNSSSAIINNSNNSSANSSDPLGARSRLDGTSPNQQQQQQQLIMNSHRYTNNNNNNNNSNNTRIKAQISSQSAHAIHVYPSNDYNTPTANGNNSRTARIAPSTHHQPNNYQHHHLTHRSTNSSNALTRMRNNGGGATTRRAPDLSFSIDNSKNTNMIPKPKLTTSASVINGRKK